MCVNKIQYCVLYMIQRIVCRRPPLLCSEGDESSTCPVPLRSISRLSHICLGRSYRWSQSFWFPHQIPIMCIAAHSISDTCLIHLILMGLFTSVIMQCSVDIAEFFIMQFSSSSYSFLLVRPKYLPQHPVLEHCQPMFFPQCESKFHTCTKLQAKL